MLIPESVQVGEHAVDAVVDEDGRVLVVVRRVCEALGLDVVSQRQRLLQAPWANGRAVMREVRDALGRGRHTLVIDQESIPMWFSGIPAEKVSADARDRLIVFQEAARDALARHFGVGCQTPSNPITRTSGGIVPSGGAAPTGARQMLAMIDGLRGVLLQTLDEVDEVRADVAELRQAAAAAHEAAEVARRQADRVMAESTMAREDRRRCDAAVKVITRATQGHCARTGAHYRDVYSRYRRALGLRPSKDGGPTLGRAKLTGSQLLILARAATAEGVPGVGIAAIESLLRGDDDATRRGAIDVVGTLVGPVVYDGRTVQ